MDSLRNGTVARLGISPLHLLPLNPDYSSTA
jgi:hypothetical protein